MTEETQTTEPVNTVTDGDPAPVSPTPEEKGRQMTFTVLDSGEIRADFGPGLDPLTLNPGEIPESLISAAVAEGLMSRARGYTSKLTGDARTPAALREVIAKAFDNMRQGVWKIERVGGGSEFSIEQEAAWVFRAKRAAAKGETFTGTLEEAAAAFTGLSDEQKKTLKGLPLYRLCYAEVKAKRDAEKLEKLKADASKAEGFEF